MNCYLRKHALDTKFRDFAARRKAKEMESKCAVVFFDEIDALGRSRVDEGGGNASQSSGDNSSRRVLAELLIQMTELSSDNAEDIDSENDSGSENEEEEEEYHGYCGEDFVGDDNQSIASSNDARVFTQRENNASSQVQPEVLSPRSISPELGMRKGNDPSEIASTEAQQEKQCNSGKSDARPRVIVVAATNRPEDCDPALLRRFAVRVLVGLPSRKDRKKIIKRLLSDVEHTISSCQLDDLALATEGWSGSDLESMTREAVMAPVRECLRAAAILKKKSNKATVKRTGSGGDSSQVQAEHKSAEDVHSATRETLLNSFRNLRPVLSRDFEHGIAFFLGEQENSAFSHFGSNSKMHSHYDSSSSSDSED